MNTTSKLILAATLALAPSACMTTRSPNASTASTPPATAPQTQRTAHGADPADVLLSCAMDLRLGPAQHDAVRAIKAELDASEASTKAAFQSVETELAREVRAGAIDLAQVRPLEESAIAALRAHIDMESLSIDRLHAMLGATDRGTLIANVRNDESVRLTSAEMPKGRAEHLAKMTRMLDLDADQQRTLATILDALPEMESHATDRDARMARVLYGFGGDVFDAKSALVSARSAPVEDVREHVEHKAAMLSQLVPILRPDQREKLAAHLEEKMIMQGRR